MPFSNDMDYTKISSNPAIAKAIINGLPNFAPTISSMLGVADGFMNNLQKIQPTQEITVTDPVTVNSNTDYSKFVNNNKTFNPGDHNIKSLVAINLHDIEGIKIIYNDNSTFWKRMCE